MTFADGLWIALARATLVALVATAVASAIVRVLRWGRFQAMGATDSEASPRAESSVPPGNTRLPRTDDCARQASLRCPWHPLAASLLLIWVTPTLMVGYAYSDGPFSLARHAAWNELLYSSLLMLKLLPIAAAVLFLAPAPPLSREAEFLRKIAAPTSALAAQRVRHTVAFLLHGRLRNPLLALVVVLLLAFQDFELAALMNVASGRAHSAYTWTIALHEARQLSAPISDIVTRALAAVLVQLAVLAAAGLLLWRTRHGGSGASIHATPSRAQAFIAWLTSAVALIAIVVLPGFILLRGTIEGLGELLTHFRFGDEMLASFYFAAGATAVVLVMINWLGAPRRQAGAAPDDRRTAHLGRCSRCGLLVVILAMPGLLGALTLGMLLVGLFQLPVLRGLYDTPAPLILGLSLLVLPVALLLNHFFRSNEPREAVYLASLLRQSGDTSQRRAGRSLAWLLRGRATFLLAAFVFFFCYLELVMSVTLAPIAMTPAIVELYNQMHYGQRALLSALMAVTVATPVVIAAVALLLLSLGERKDSKRRTAAF